MPKGTASSPWKRSKGRHTPPASLPERTSSHQAPKAWSSSQMSSPHTRFGPNSPPSRQVHRHPSHTHASPRRLSAWNAASPHRHSAAVKPTSQPLYAGVQAVTAIM